MSQPFYRTILFAALTIALLAALPAAAGPAQPAAGVATPSCQAAAPTLAGPALPEWLATSETALSLGTTGIEGRSSNRFHFGYCPCGCSSIKNCNTNADCGGATCSPTFSCC